VGLVSQPNGWCNGSMGPWAIGVIVHIFDPDLTEATQTINIVSLSFSFFLEHEALR
jgi:hypothetical protein